MVVYVFVKRDEPEKEREGLDNKEYELVKRDEPENVRLPDESKSNSLLKVLSPAKVRDETALVPKIIPSAVVPERSSLAKGYNEKRFSSTIFPA